MNPNKNNSVDEILSYELFGEGEIIDKVLKELENHKSRAMMGGDKGIHHIKIKQYDNKF